MEITQDQLHQSLSELVVSLPSARQVLDRYNLDFCCGGKQSLEEACQQQGLDPESILSEIQNTQPINGGLPLHVQNWSTGFLIDFIEQNYHRYVRESIPVLLELLDKISDVHGLERPELYNVRSEFNALAEELLSHMKKEEMILFPALREFEQNKKSNDPIVSMIDRPIAVMEEEHQLAGDILKFLRAQTNQYQVPPGACPTFTYAYQKLAEFDQELINHIHLENNVLFKRTV